MGDTRKPPGSGLGDNGDDDSRFPWMQPVNEDLVIDVDNSGPNIALMVAGVVVVLLFSAFIYYIYVQGQDSDINGEIPVVKADGAPVRVEPEVRGGIEVPHQERLVFDRVTGEATDVEDNLRSAPEEPLSLSDATQAAAMETAPQNGADSANDFTDSSAQDVEIQPSASDTESSTVDVSAPITSTDAEGADVNNDSAMFTPKGRYLVQVGAFSSLEAADKFWTGLQGKYPMILKGLSDEVQRAELGARVLYRLRIGYLMTRGEADRVCSDLKSRGQDCMVVNPK